MHVNDTHLLQWILKRVMLGISLLVRVQEVNGREKGAVVNYLSKYAIGYLYVEVE